MKKAQIYLTRRNLETLLAKLDKNKANPGTSFATLVKQDTHHSNFPQTEFDQVYVTALENEDYYTDREPGVTMEDLE